MNVRDEYAGIERSPSDLPRVEATEQRVPDRRVVRDWAVPILSVLIGILVVVTITALIAIGGLVQTVKDVQDDQIESKARACASYAQSGEYFPPSCLDRDVLDLYAHDVIDVLAVDGNQGRHRELLCDALKERGITDTDCVSGA